MIDNKYIYIPQFTTINNIIEKNYTLSSTQYKSFNIKNKNLLNVADFMRRKLTNKDLGCEVGSESYIDKSPYFFIKTKALQPESYLLDNTKESILNIVPSSFVNMNLKQGDILISKDSNVGEVVILEKDYPNTMVCGGIYKLPVNEDMKYYLLAFIKSDIFRKQIDFLVPRGSTIRHGKTKFLECLIPIPNINKERTIKYVNTLMKSIIMKEVEINKKYKNVSQFIFNELNKNQKDLDYVYRRPSISEIINKDRMDSSIYTEKFRKINFTIKNYINGYTFIPEKNIKGGNTPKQRVISENSELSNYWVTPTIYTNIGLLMSNPTIECRNNNINDNCLLIVNRTSKGDDGEYVGMSYFYNYDNLGKGHHNQGIYRIDAYSKEYLIYLNALFNSSLYRIYFGALSKGSKMKEIKIGEIVQVPIPCFPESIMNKIVKMYSNSIEYEAFNYKFKDFEDFLDYDRNFNAEAGIYDLEKSLIYLKNKLKETLDNIANDIEVKTSF